MTTPATGTIRWQLGSTGARLARVSKCCANPAPVLRPPGRVGFIRSWRLDCSACGAQLAAMEYQEGQVTDEQAAAAVAEAMAATAEPEWLTWPPARALETGHEYLVVTKYDHERLERQMRVSYLGADSGGALLQFNARPAAGTQTIPARAIVRTRDLGASGGREDGRRYVGRVLRP